MTDERSPRLVLLDDSGEVFELPEGVTRIGRAPGNEVRLADTTVSRFHCHLVRSGREVRVEDSDSHNSTRVNGQHAGETRLADGDVLRVGRLKLRYDDPAAVQKPSVTPAGKRDRYVARRRGPALFPLLCLLIAILGLSWLYIASSFTARTPAGEPAALARVDRGLSSELAETQRQLELQNARLEEVRSRFGEAQAALDALEKSYQRELAALREEYEDGEGESRDKALYRQILSLESTIRELGEQRATDRELFREQLEETTRRIVAGESADGVPSLGSRTAVSRVQPRPALSKKEVAGLVEDLQRAAENYASVEATPESLEPALGTLSAAGGGEAARGLLGVLAHARDLLKKLDDNMAFMTRRTERLLAEAAAAGGSTSEGSGGKKEGSSYTAGVDLEKRQRELELFERRIAIKKQQRERLVALIDAVKAGFERMTDPDAVRHLLGVFGRTHDVETRLAILGSLRASSSPEAVPALLKRFTVREEPVREAVREALIVIAGKDLGDNREDWERWWAEQRL